MSVAVKKELLLKDAHHLSYVKDVLFSGGIGDVYKGTYKVKSSDRTKEHVAVKTFRIFEDQSLDEVHTRLNREATVWKEASTHPSILRFYGVVQLPTRTALVSPWVDGGTVNHYLSKGNRKSDKELLLKLLKQTSEGVKHLHSKRIVHGDIKGNNLLVDSNGDIKITDFGRAFIVDNIAATLSLMGAAPWLAPELLENMTSGEDEPPKLSYKSDMWALGITVLEIFDDISPWSKKGQTKSQVRMLKKIVNGERPQKDDYLTAGSVEGLWEQVNKCWEFKPEARISIVEFCTGLQQVSV